MYTSLACRQKISPSSRLGPPARTAPAPRPSPQRSPPRGRSRPRPSPRPSREGSRDSLDSALSRELFGNSAPQSPSADVTARPAKRGRALERDHDRARDDRTVESRASSSTRASSVVPVPSNCTEITLARPRPSSCAPRSKRDDCTFCGDPLPENAAERYRHCAMHLDCGTLVYFDDGAFLRCANLDAANFL